MGKNFDQIVKELPKLGAGAFVKVTLVSNQNNGVVSYAQGWLNYVPGISVVEDPSGIGTPGNISGNLGAVESTEGGDSAFLFSHKTRNVKPPTGDITLPLWQPFDVFKSAGLKLSIELPVLLGSSTPPTGVVDPPPVTFTLPSSGGVTFTVATETVENLLFGVGTPPTVSEAAQAVYLIAFTAITGPAKPPA